MRNACSTSQEGLIVAISPTRRKHTQDTVARVVRLSRAPQETEAWGCGVVLGLGLGPHSRAMRPCGGITRGGRTCTSRRPRQRQKCLSCPKHTGRPLTAPPGTAPGQARPQCLGSDHPSPPAPSGPTCNRLWYLGASHEQPGPHGSFILRPLTLHPRWHGPLDGTETSGP